MDVLDSKVAATLATNFTGNPELLELLSGEDNLSSSSLRMRVESSSLELSMEFESMLRDLVEDIKGVDEEVGKIQSLAEDIVKSATAASNGGATDDGSSTDSPAAQITRIVKERDEAVAKMKAVKAFLSKFEIREATERALNPASFSVATGSRGGKDFLLALGEVGKARENLRSAFDGTGPDDANPHSSPNIGIQMLEKLADQQEQLYERLYEWIQGYLGLTIPTSSSDAVVKRSDEELENAYADEFVVDAIAALEDRPAFAEHVRELVCGSRRAAVTRRFLTALGSGGGGIELRANDPVGYISDILAWIHQAVAGEGEVLESLFDGLNGGEGGVNLADMLSQTTSGVARPFKSRTLSVIENLAFSNDDVVEMDERGSRYKIVSLYSTFGVLQFYHVQLAKVAESLKSHGESLKLFVGTGRTGWGGSASVTRDSVGSLASRVIMELADTNAMYPGFASTKTANEVLGATTSVNHVVESILSPAVHLTDQLDDLLKLRDCLVDVKGKGLAEDVSEKWRENIENKLQRIKDGLVGKVVEDILGRVGLGEILSLISEEETMATVIGLEEATVADKIAKFYGFLANFPTPNLDDTINSASERVQIRKEVVGRVVEGYRKIVNKVVVGGYQNYEAWILHSPEDVEALLSV